MLLSKKEEFGLKGEYRGPLEKTFMSWIAKSYLGHPDRAGLGSDFVTEYASELEPPFGDTFIKAGIRDADGKLWFGIEFHAYNRSFILLIPDHEDSEVDERIPLLFTKSAKLPSAKEMDDMGWYLFHFFEGVAKATD